MLHQYLTGENALHMKLPWSALAAVDVRIFEELKEVCKGQRLSTSLLDTDDPPIESKLQPVTKGVTVQSLLLSLNL